MMKRAGTVKTIPLATDVPADPMVWTMLFSRMLFRRKMDRKTPIEMTAAGIDALTVIPTLRPRNAFAAPKRTPIMTPRMTDSSVNSRPLPMNHLVR